MPLFVGGISADVRPADEVVHGIVDKLQDELRSKVAEKRESVSASELNLVAVAYKTQIVAGTNFFIKVKVAEGDFIHARVYRDLQGNVSLHSISETKTETDEILHF